MKRYGWMIILVGLAILAGIWLTMRNPDNHQKGPDLFLEKGLQNIPLIKESKPLPLESAGSIAASTLEKLIQSATASLEIFDVTSSQDAQSPRRTLRRGAYQILGNVISIAQAPIDGATVVCRELGQGFRRTPQEWTVSTNGGGEFAFSFGSPGRFELIAWKSGYTRGSAQVELTIPGPEVAKVILRPGNIIQGTVKENFTGQLLAGANVWASAQMRIYAQDEMRPQFGISTKTASDGSYLIEGLQPDQIYTLVASDGFHAPEVRRDIKPGGVAVDFLLNPGAQVSGRVIWEGDRSPVEGAHVSMGFGMRPPGRGGPGGPGGTGGPRGPGGSPGGNPFQRFSPVQLNSATTDSDGRFTIGGLPAGRRIPLSASYQESEELIYRSEPEWVELAAREHKTDVELVIARRPPIRIHGVVRELDRSTVKDAVVTLSFGMPGGGFGRGGQGGRLRGMMQRFASEMPQDETLTDENGKYEFLLSFGGPRHVEAYKDDFYARPEGTADLMINPQVQEYELNFVLFPGATLHGKVYREDTGEPIPKVSIRLRSQDRSESSGPWDRGSSRYDKEMETGTVGLYEFSGLAPGVYALRILETPDEYVVPEEDEEIVIEESKSLVHDVSLRAGLYIKGIVLYPDGQPASGARLTGYVLEGGKTLSDESDALGEFELTAFPIDCEVRLYVRPLDFPELNPAPLLTEKISLRDSLEDFELNIPEEGKVSILVKSSEDTALRGQRVVCVYNPDDPLEEWDSNLPRRFTFERTSNYEGIAQFDRLTPGPWKVTIETRGNPVVGDFVAYENETAELTLVIPVEDLVDNSGVLAGTIRFEDGTPAERTRVTAELQGDKENVEAGSRGMGQTDQEGKFRIRGLRQDKPFKLEIRARRASQDHEGVMTTSRELEYILPNSGGISARVVAADGQPPTSLWTATLFNLEDGRSRPVFESPETLQSLGMVNWESLGQGTYQILVAGPEIARAYSELIDVLPDELTDEIEIHLPEPVEFSGEVVDADTGKGIPGVEVIEQLQEGSMSRWSQSSYQRRVFTDTVGDFLMMGLPPGPIRLRLEHSAYESGTYEAEEITNREETIVLQKVSLSE